MIVDKCEDCNQDHNALDMVEVNLKDGYVIICEDCLDKRKEKGEDIYVDD